MRKHISVFILLSIVLAGCGGVTSQNGEDDNAFSGHPGPHPPIHFCWADPAYISLDSLNGLYKYSLIGEPLVLYATTYANQLAPSPNEWQFSHPIVFDGVTVDAMVDYATRAADGSTVPQARNWVWIGPPVTLNTPLVHTASLTSTCGTETKQFTMTRMWATTPVPTLTALATYVAPGTDVELDGSRSADATTCVFSRGHLVGTQDYDGKVVVDEVISGNVNSWKRPVTPAHNTTYTLTESCTMATNTTPNSTTAKVTVYEGASACKNNVMPVTYQFCMSCPASLDGEAPWTWTQVETRCSYDDARAQAQSAGTNCSLMDGACS